MYMKNIKNILLIKCTKNKIEQIKNMKDIYK